MRLPIIRSLFSPNALAQVVQRVYGLAHVRCQLIKTLMADTYLVTSASGRAILRVYPAGRDAGPIEAEVAFLEFLHRHGVPVAAPIRPTNGDQLLTLGAAEGTRHAVLSAYAPGTALGARLDPTTAGAFGRLVAQLHVVADGFHKSHGRPALGLVALLDQPLQALAPHVAMRKDLWTELLRCATIVRARIASLPTTAPFFGFCHGDTVPDNAHLAADGTIVLFDFDFCGPGWRAYDVAVALLEMDEADLRRAFLAGYEEVRALTAEEVASIPHFQGARIIWRLGQIAANLDQLGTLRLGDALLDHALLSLRVLLGKRE